MNKNEFLAFSLPYGLKCCTVEITRINDLISCHFGNMVLARVKPNDDVDFPLPIEQIKPILHPLSDLTKEIEHKGEKFVPMIELAKIEGSQRDGEPADVESSYKGYVLNSGIMEFIYDHDNKSFHLSIGMPNDRVRNQLLLFQKLIEWHFDIADLISKGEAIDVNTLETNPYK